MLVPYRGTFRVSQTFKGSAHQGLDLVGVESKSIYSIFDATIEVASYADPNGFGLYVRQRITSGPYTGCVCYYGHMSAVQVQVGQSVRMGDLLGTEGSSGVSTGSHCHLEVRRVAADFNSYLDISEITGIPNQIHTNPNLDNEIFEEAEEMTQEQFNEMFDVAMAAHDAALAAAPGSQWSLEDRNWAVENGLIVGNEEGNFQWRAPMSREEVVAFVRRFAQQIE